MLCSSSPVSSSSQFLSCILLVLFHSASSPARFLTCILLLHSLLYPHLLCSWSVSCLFFTILYHHRLFYWPVSCLVLFCSLSCSIPFCILACSIPVLYLACFIPSVSCPVFIPLLKKSYILPRIIPALSVCDKSIYFLLPMKTQHTYTLSNDLDTKGIYLYFFVYLYCIVRDFLCVKGVKNNNILTKKTTV